MDMVWHQYKCVDIIAGPIQVQQARLDLCPHVRPSQMAGAHASIQLSLYAADKSLFIFTLLGRKPWFRMPSQPDRALISPLAKERLRQGISEPKGDKVG